MDAVNEAPCNGEVDIKEEPLDPKVSYCTCFNQIRAPVQVEYKNTSTIVPASHKRRRKGNRKLEGIEISSCFILCVVPQLQECIAH